MKKNVPYRPAADSSKSVAFLLLMSKKSRNTYQSMTNYAGDLSYNIRKRENMCGSEKPEGSGSDEQGAAARRCAGGGNGKM